MALRTEERELLLDTTRRFMTAETSLGMVRKWAETGEGFDRGWWRTGCDLGWTSLLVTEEHGGAALSDRPFVDVALLATEFGRAVAPGPFLPCNVVAAAVTAGGSEEQQTALLPRLVAGDAVAAWCFGEPDGGAFPTHVRLAATPTADGVVLDGAKTLVEAAAQADCFLVTARGPDGLVQALVPADAPGVCVRVRTGLDFVRRYADVVFDDTEVSAVALVQSEHGVAADVQRQLEMAVVLQCAEMVGAADRVFEFTVEYAFDRHSFGRPLASYQALKHRFADMKTWLEASRATTTAAALAVAERRPDAAKLVSVAKAYVGDHTAELVQGCVQMHGAIGVTWEHDLHLYLRRIVVDRGTFGTPDEHRVRVGSIVQERGGS